MVQVPSEHPASIVAPSPAAPIVLALLINEAQHRGARRFFQTVSYLPNFMSWVIVGGMIISMLSVENGSINMLLEFLGMIDEPVNWLSESSWFWPILVVSNVCKDVGFGSIIYLAAMFGINPEFYEAGAVDGATRLQMMRHITLPSIKTQIIVLVILALDFLAELTRRSRIRLRRAGWIDRSHERVGTVTRGTDSCRSSTEVCLC